MRKRTRAIAITASMTIAGIALGATIASAASGSNTKVPALQSTGSRYVFACVNPAGGIDYLEFRAPLPHQCWFSGESLWYWDAVPLAGAVTTPSPTPTPTVSPTPTASPSPTATPAKPVIANVETTPLSYQAKAAAVAITSTLTISDSGATMITGATVSITGGFSSSSTDTLTFPTNANGITGSYSASTGVLTLTGSATVANYQAALRSVEFSTMDSATSPAARTVSFTVTDSASQASNTATRMIDVTAAG